MGLDAAYSTYNNLQSVLSDNEVQYAQKIKICFEMFKMLNSKDLVNEPKIILSKIYLYLAQFYIQLKDWNNSALFIKKSIENDRIYYNQYMDWTETNVVIKSVSNKYLK